MAIRGGMSFLWPYLTKENGVFVAEDLGGVRHFHTELVDDLYRLYANKSKSYLNVLAINYGTREA